MAEQHHLQQLALFGFQVGQQAQPLQRRDRQRLCLVDQQDGASPLASQLDQPGMQRGEQPVGVQLLDVRHVQLMGERLTQRQRAERRVGQPGELVARRVQLVEQRATQQRLAGATSPVILMKPSLRPARRAAG